MKKCYGRGSAPFENSSTVQILRPFWPGREGDSKLLFWEQRIGDRFDRWIGINFIFDEISKRRDALIVSMLICQCCDVILWKTSNEKKKKYIPPPPPFPICPYTPEIPLDTAPLLPLSKFFPESIAQEESFLLGKMNISIIVTLRIVLKRKKEKKIARF